MPDLVSPAVVTIIRAGAPIGTGFLLSPELLLTSDPVRGYAPGELVSISFSPAPEPDVPATVDRILAVAGRRVAILRAARPLAAGGLRLVDAKVPIGRRVTVVSPASRHRRFPAMVAVTGRGADGLIVSEPLGNPSVADWPGAPAVDERLGGVIGMVAGTADNAGRVRVTLLPAGALYAAWPALAELDAPPTPFRGLAPFGPTDAPLFTGRDREIARVRRHLAAHGRVVVTGPAGSGKSSLVLAGLLPRLREVGVGVVIVRPAGEDGPWLTLATGLAGILGPAPGAMIAAKIAQRLAEEGFTEIRQMISAAGQVNRVVIVLDQLEELYERFPDETDAMLAELWGDEPGRPPPGVELVVTARLDRLRQLRLDEWLTDQLTEHAVTPRPPDFTDLLTIVRRRLEPPGMPVYSPGLVDIIAAEAAEEEAPLPLVEYTLARLWERQERGVLTHRAYRELGGVRGAVPAYAESVRRDRVSAAPRRIRRRWLVLAAVLVIELLLTAVTLVNVGEARAVNRERQAAAASVELLTLPAPLRASETLARRARAWLTHDNVTTRSLLRQSFRDYRYAAVVLPSDYRALGISRLNPAGTHAIVLGEELGDAGEAGHADVYDLTADPPTATRIPVSPGGLSPTRLSWLGPDHLVVLAGPTVSVWELSSGRRTAVIEPAGLDLADGRLGSLVTGASGRWVGWTDPAAAEVHVLDVSAPSAPPGVVRLPAKIWVRHSEEPDTVDLLGLTPAGEVTVRHRDTVLDLSPERATPVPDPPPGYPVSWDGQTNATECLPQDGYRLRSVLTGEVLAEQPAPEISCEPGVDSAAFSSDGRHIALIPRAGGPLYLGRPGTDLRALPIPQSMVERIAAEPDGGYRVVLATGGELVVLRVSPMDRLDRALAGANSGMVIGGTGQLLLHSDDLLEVWHPDSRRRLAAMPVAGLSDLEGASRVTPSDDGRLLAVTSRGSTRVQLFDLPDLTPTATFEPAGLGENIHVVDVDRERRLLVKRALSYTVWTDTGEPLSVELPIPVDMPTAHVYLRPGHAEVVAIADGTLRRYGFAGAEVPGSLIDLGGDDRTGPSGRPGWTAIDRSGRYLALVGLETLDVWELDTGRSVGHLPLTQGQLPDALAGLTFDGEDPHLIHIAVGPDQPASRFDAGSDPLGQLTWRWRDSSLRHRLTPWVRFSDDPVWTAADETPAWRPHLTTTLELEPTDPRVWLDRACDLMSASPQATPPTPPPSLPDAAYDGPLCPT